MAINNENNTQVAVVALGSLTTDATLLPALHLPKKSKIKSVKVMNGAAIAASDTNYVQLSLKSGDDVVAELDSRAAHEDGLEANVSKALNVDSTYETLDAASDLTLLYNEGGTVAMTNAMLFIEFFPL